MNSKSGWLPAEPPLLTSLSAWYGLWRHWVNQGKRRLPKHWPLHARVVLNQEELRVWHWLIATFDDHHVMIKMPVTRFTRPNASENGLYWYELLKNISCTFSVCADDGHIIGCIDVRKSVELSHKVTDAKQGLLKQCGICYLTVSAAGLPEPANVRHAFLGEAAAKTRHLKREEAIVEAARESLRKTLQQQRRKRAAGVFQGGRERSADNMPSHWHDSFLIQANSRPAELR